VKAQGVTSESRISVPQGRTHRRSMSLDQVQVSCNYSMFTHFIYLDTFILTALLTYLFASLFICNTLYLPLKVVMVEVDSLF